MKKEIAILFFYIILGGAACNEEPNVMSFQDKYGILYFNKPVSGLTIRGFFLPFKMQSDVNLFEVSSDLDLYKEKFSNGISFNIENGKIISLLYLQAKKVGFKQNRTKADLYMIVCKLRYHINERIFKGNEMTKSLTCDTLSNNNEYFFSQHYFSHLEIDTIFKIAE